MKIYSIGRENECDIIINDASNVISRRHAMLTISRFGKMTITDQSQNGTYVNGIRISPNVPVPITRNDTISFAHIAQLDWRLIPNQFAKLLWWCLGSICALLVVIGLIWWLTGTHSSDSKPDNTYAADTVKVNTDSTKNSPAANAEEAKEKKDEATKQSTDTSVVKKDKTNTKNNTNANTNTKNNTKTTNKLQTKTEKKTDTETKTKTAPEGQAAEKATRRTVGG